MQALVLISTFAAPEEPPWWDVAWSTWALVGVGVATAYIAIKTLRDIKKQTKNTEIAALAALRNAEAVINAERSWIMVELERVPGMGGIRTRGDSTERDSYTTARFRLKCVNVGKTIAWIDEKSACLQIFDKPPQKPNLSKLQILSIAPQWIESNGMRHSDETIDGEGQERIGLMSVVWGFIKYRDAFGEHATTFGFRILPDDRLERLSGFPAYNETT